ncbi:hypothetical protein HFK83_15805 [Ralstonia pseudosolanacearum]|uniref:hypothetical protein n=1 Tax=Ralstonia solanacearum species complex TaxID=3116862 RepID=UPI0002DC4F54|nr:hypothetical protein [Ralstonia pseudosolanacearum]MCK4123825.1 hypothetical protein [Ralstonia pseudosolanacearum]
MANKTLGTRQKLTFRIEPSTRAGTARPRNILVPLARGRKAGAHTDGDHAERQRDHADVRRALRTMNEDDKE